MLPRAVTIGLVLIGTDPEDEERTIDLPFLTTVVLEYGQGFGRSMAFAPVASSPNVGGGGGGGGGRGGGTRPPRTGRPADPNTVPGVRLTPPGMGGR